MMGVPAAAASTVGTSVGNLGLISALPSSTMCNENI